MLKNGWMRVRLHGGAVVLEYAGDPEWAAIAATELLRDIAGPHTQVTIKNVETRKGDQFAAHELLDAEEGFKLFAKLCGADSVRKLALRRLHADLLEHPAKAVDRLVARRAQMDEEEEVDDPNAKPDFLDDDIAASYINDHHRKIGSTIVVFPIHEPVTAGFTDSIKQEWFLRDDPNFLEKWAEEIWEQEHRVAVTEPHHSLDPHDGDEDDGW